MIPVLFKRCSLLHQPAGPVYFRIGWRELKKAEWRGIVINIFCLFCEAGVDIILAWHTQKVNSWTP